MFNLETWKRNLRERLPGWKARMEAAGSHTLYGFLAAMSLWPLVEAARSGQVLPVAMTLGGIAAGVGGNLLADQVLKWKERSAAEVEDEIIAWTTSQSAQPELRDAFDAILIQLDLMPQAQTALAETDRLWFQEALRDELARLGNLKSYEAVLLGPGVIAQDHSFAAGRDLILNIYQQAHGRPAMDPATLATALDRYLGWVEKRYGRLELRGIERREEELPSLSLDQVYVSLAAAVRPKPKKGGAKNQAPEMEAGEPQTLDMSQLLGLGPRLIITGGPGSGKTTFLRIIASSLAHALRTGEASSLTDAWGKEAPVPLPIFVSLADYNRYRRRHTRATDPRKGTLLAFLSESLIGQQAILGLPDDFFERLLLQGQSCALLLDGLDEVAKESDRALVRQAVETLSYSQGLRAIIVTSRTRAHQGPALLPEAFQRAEVLPMSPEQVDALTRRWCEAVYDEISAPAEIEALQTEIGNLERLRKARGETKRLIDSPLLVTIVAIVHHNKHRLPEKRAELYDNCVEVLLAEPNRLSVETTQELAALGGGTLTEKRQWLAFLAFQMMSAGESAGRVVSEEQMKKWLRPRLASNRGEDKAGPALDDFIQAIGERGSLLDERDRDYRFLHLSFQEYLAAYHLVEDVRAVDKMVAFLEAEGRLSESWWRETVLLTAGYLGLKSQGSALAFVRGLAACAATNSLALAGAELAAASFLELDSQDAGTKKLVVDRLVDLIGDAKLTAPGPLRAAAGRILARLGDPRPGVGLDPNTGLPDLAWSNVIAPGPFPMGNDKDEAGYDDEIPRFTCRLIAQSYRISRYPITVAQYRAFVAAKGYQQRRYWTEAGWEWRQRHNITGPHDFGEPFTLDNHPQVGVSWDEAVAFCRWLSEQSGQDIRLPSEAEWERASRHTDARRYPWGNAGKPAEHCNIDETGIGSTCSVGLFANGHALCDAADMSGNVWEWCSTKWLDDYGDYERKVDDDLEGDATRVLRGGSWFGPNFAASAVRNGDHPYNRNDYGGFRVALRLASLL